MGDHQDPPSSEDPHERLERSIMDTMTEDIIAAYERGLARMLESPDNWLNPDSAASSLKFRLVMAAFAAAVRLEGEDKARDSFEMASMRDEPIRFMFGLPMTERQQLKRAKKTAMQKASRKANRR